jgi:hypothetical protein
VNRREIHPDLKAQYRWKCVDQIPYLLRRLATFYPYFGEKIRLFAAKLSLFGDFSPNIILRLKSTYV